MCNTNFIRLLTANFLCLNTLIQTQVWTNQSLHDTLIYNNISAKLQVNKVLILDMFQQRIMPSSFQVTIDCYKKYLYEVT